jgi:hypothetical protein
MMDSDVSDEGPDSDPNTGPRNWIHTKLVNDYFCFLSSPSSSVSLLIIL